VSGLTVFLHHVAMPIPRAKRTISRDAEYASALDYLDAKHSEGTISPSEYEIRRARMLAEAVKTPWPASVQLLVGFATVVVVLIILGVFFRFLGAVLG